MVQFSCSTKAREKALRRLCETVTRHGGLIDDRLVLGDDDGSVFVRAPFEAEPRHKMILIPKDILLPVDKYDIAIEGDDMVMKGYDKDLNKGQVEIMQAMLDVYNLTGKVAQLKATSTMGLIFSDRPVLDELMKMRTGGPQEIVAKMKEMEGDKFWVKAFWKTRVLGFREKVVRPAEGAPRPEGEAIHMLMPVIDFINHHPRAPGFFTSFRNPDEAPIEADETEFDTDGVTVMKATPVEGSDECYVSYGVLDAGDALLNYNYVDQCANFMRSVPVSVQIPGLCSMKINSFGGRPTFKKLPKQLEDLRFYMPVIVAQRPKKNIGMSMLMIPQAQAPRSMRRILAFAINQLEPAISGQRAMDAVLEAERQVLRENERFFKKLLEFTTTYKPKTKNKLIMANVKQLAERQLQVLQGYPFYEDVIGKEPKPKVRAASQAKRKRKAG